MSGRLFIDFCGEESDVGPTESLSFGRVADIEIDTNPYLHRRVGLLEYRAGDWWLTNTGSSILLNVHDRARRNSAVVSPGGRLALTMAEFSIGFSAGPHAYEVLGVVEDVDLSIDLEESGDGDRTLEWGVVELNEDQHHLLLALCEPALRSEIPEFSTPASRACALRLGWSMSKFNRKLDHLCRKLSRVGVSGLHGESGNNATGRRKTLAEHALRAGLVTAADLSLLDPADLPEEVDA